MTDTAAPAVLTTRNGHILIVTINRPEARNAVNAAVHVGIGTALDEAESDPEIRVVIITGAGRAFSAGQDLGDMQARITDPDFPAGKHGFPGLITALTDSGGFFIFLGLATLFLL